jgi:diguanylate cyclase (GGDEF)-like protein/PAS domain S-box-containing protein
MTNQAMTKRELEAELASLRDRLDRMDKASAARLKSQLALQDSEAEYRVLVDNLSVGVYRSAADPRGHFLQANPALVAMFGFDSAEEFMKTEVADLYQDPAQRKRFISQLQASGRVANRELHLRTKDGRAFIASCTASIHYDADGRPAWIDGVIEDITRRKEAEKALRASEERYRNLVEASFDGIFIQDESTIVFANQRLHEMLGYRTGDLVGLEFWRIYHPDFHEVTRARAQARMSGEPLPSRFEVRLLRLDGTDFDGEISAKAIDLEGRPGIQVWVRDISEQKQAARALRDSEEKRRDIFDNVSDFLFAHDLAGNFTETNQAFINLAGHRPEEMARLNVKDLIPARYRSEFDGYLSTLLKQGKSTGLMRVISSQGEERIVEYRNSVIYDDQGRPTAIRGSARDITEKIRTEAALRKSQAMLARAQKMAGLGNWELDLGCGELTCSDEIYHIGGLNPVPERPTVDGFLHMVHRDDRTRVEQWLNQAQDQGGPTTIEHRIVQPEGEVRIVHQLVEVERHTPTGRPVKLVGTVQDITALRKSEEQIAHQAYHDPLTGLPNRLLFNDRLKMALASAHRKGVRLAILFLDLDHFKNINDSLGHAVGDLLLQAVAKRLVRWVRAEDTVARLGGDEFILLLPGIENADLAVHAAQRIQESLRVPFSIREHELHVSVSVGITIFPDDGRDLDTLVRNADLAMYRAKDHGRDQYCLFTPAMNERMIKRMVLEADLRRAIERNEFLVHYQPKVDLATGRVTGLEALVRWQRPRVGLVAPDKFIPLAEETGLIVPLGLWVLRTACAQTRKWHEAGFGGLVVSVNLSPRQFRERDLVPMVGRVLDETGLPPDCLELEITENVVMHSVVEAIETLERLSSLGIRLSLDDFGRGYSSLYYLKRFPMNTLKIDRSFVADIATDRNDAAIVDTIISMGRSLNLMVIAEGVETEEQLALLRKHKCDQMQGFLFSRPVPADEITALLTSDRRLGG